MVWGYFFVNLFPQATDNNDRVMIAKHIYEGTDMENINLRKAQEAADGYGIFDDMRKQGAREASIGEMDAFDAVEHVQYKQDRSVSNNAETVMNNFEEYRRDMQEKAKAEQENAAADEHEANEEAKEIARSLTNEEIKQLRMMGIDVDSASLSDLMDIVNTMRSEAHKEALTQVLAQAKVQNGDYDNVLITGSGVKTAGGETTLDNVDILYLIKNKLPMNRDNLYKAHYSGQRAPEQADKLLPDGMEEQLKKVILQAGIPVDETSMNGAKQMLFEGIPVTTDTMRDYMQLAGNVGKDIADIAQTDTRTEIPQASGITQAEALCRKVWMIAPDTVAQMVRDNQPVTIASAYVYQEAKTRTDGQTNEQTDAQQPENNGMQVQGTTEQELREITMMRHMEEIRLRMTEQVAGRMLKADINIDTRELSQVVAELRAVERQLTQELFARQEVAFTEENVSAYRDMTESLRAIGDAPAERLGRLLKQEPVFTTREVARVVSESSETLKSEAEAPQESLSGARIRREFAQAERSYEALGTAPRADMGDSIRKAFGNIGDILQEMELPMTEEHVRAVRILGYNSIEITQSSIEQVIEYDRQVNDLMDACYPEAVLGMIRDGINPMDVPIDELNIAIRQKRYHAGVTEADNFATYLRDVEKQGGISAEERESYIGIYRMFDKLRKSGDREAGYLFANGSRLTVRNLLTAMRSRRASGIDVSVDDSLGMLEETEVTGKKIDAQIERAFTNREETGTNIPDAFEHADIALGDMPDENSWEVLLAEPEFEKAEQLLNTFELQESAVNMQAAIRVIRDLPEHAQAQDGFYDLVSDLLKKLRFRDESEEELIDREIDAMAKSLTGEDIPVAFSTENLLETLGQDGKLSLTYADMREQLTELLYQNAAAAAVNAEDVQSAKVIQAGFHILGRMAERNQFSLPVETAEGTRLVNLKVIRDAGQTQTIQISMRHPKYEILTAKLTLSEELRISGEVLAGTSEGNLSLLAHAADFSQILSENGYPDADISFGQSRKNQGMGEVSDERNGRASGRKLMETAVFFVKALAGMTDI